MAMKVIRESRDDLVTRVRLLIFVVLGLLGGVGVGFWSVQVVRGDYYRELAESNRLRRLSVRAPRGLIYDRHGRPLVENIPSYQLFLDRSRAPDLDESLAFASRILERPVGALAEHLDGFRNVPDFRPVLLAQRLSLAQVARFGVESLEHPEFEIEVEHLRLYRHGTQTGHVLGYLGQASDEELERFPDLYSPGDLVGKRGIEEAFDPLLRGSDGHRVVVVDSRGKVLEQYGRVEAESGKDLVLTLDLELQQAAERQMRDKVGAVVALDPSDGEILALHSSPSYNPNHFAHGMTREEWARLVAIEHDPLQNRTIQNAHSPGSVFKIVMAAAGLAEGVIDGGDRVYCRGSTVIYNHRFRCWRRGGHGSVNLEEALAGSCNIFFYHLGKTLGIETIAHYARVFGLGQATGIELGGEKAGLVPDRAWSLAERGHIWFPGETISLAVGQGPLLVTPLQVARMTAVVASDGRLVQPHLVRGTHAEDPAELDLSPDLLDEIRRGLTAVVNDRTGTAYWSGRLRRVEIAGKTGTVQVVGQLSRKEPEEIPFELRNHAWFVSFAPADDPELVVVVFVEHGGSGAEAAAPIARALYDEYFRKEAPIARLR